MAKIEELFSELDKGIENLKTAREQLKVYRQAVLKHAFEGKLTAYWREQNKVLKEWKISELGKCGKWQGGGAPSKSVPAYWEDGEIFWVSPKDMKTRIIGDTQQKITELGVQNSPAKIISGTSVLFVVRSGILRRILPISIAISGVTVNQDMQAVVPSQHTVEFLYWYCESSEQTIRHECSKDGTTVESIDVGALKRFPVPIPTREEQDEIVRLIEAQTSVIENIETTIDAELQKSEALRPSILKKAFSGQLVAQDPNDEPASVLLDRIRAEKSISKLSVKKASVSQPKLKDTVMRDILEALRQEHDWLNTSQICNKIGIGIGSNTEEIENFYQQLRGYLLSQEILIERRGNEDWLKYNQSKAA